MLSKMECKKCGGEVVKAGFWDTMYRGRIQRYRCNKCRHQSVYGGIYHRYRISEATIKQILALHRQGKSLRQIRDKIKIVSHVTVANIVKHFQHRIRTK